MDKTQLANPQDHVPMIRWDDVNIEKETAHLPPELREDYRWFKSWARDTGLRDMDTITNKLRELGIDRNKTTWSKILRGRWNRNEAAEETTPVVSLDKLREEIEAVRTNQRVEALRGKVPFVSTTVWESIRDAIDARADSARVNKWVVIVGHTGSQKSACLNEFQRQRNHGRTRKIEAPENGTFSELLALIARSCGMSTSSNSAAAMRAKIFQAFGAGTPTDRARRILIIDNAQELWDTKPNSKQQSFTFLRRLQDETGCTIVLSITPIFERLLVDGMIQGWFEQIEGRSGGRNSWLRLPEFPPAEDVLMIAKAFGMVDGKANEKKLVAISREPGRIRRLFEDLQEAKLLAGKTPLTIAHIREARGEE